MSKILKIFGLDNSAAKAQAAQQAASMQQQAEATRRSAQAIADQQAQMTRQQADRQRVEEQVRALQEQAQPKQAAVDVGAPGEEEPTQRRRRAYQNPNAGASGAVRI